MAGMKIIDVETILVRQPTACPMKEYPISDGFRDCLIVKVHTDEGITGIGEVQTSPTVARAVIEAPFSLIASVGLKELILGENPFDTEALWQKMYSKTSIFGRRGVAIHAISGIDIALWDIKGKALGQPIYRLLGSSSPKPVKAYASTLMPDDPHKAACEALRWVKDGFQAVKLGWGGFTDNIRKNAALIKEVRKVLGPDITIMADAGMGWGLPTALEMARRCEEYELYFLEEPLPSDDLEGYAVLCDAVDLRIATGEKETTKWGFRDLIVRGRLDILQPDAARCGGITETIKIATLCSAFNRVCIPHNWSTDILASATLNIITALSDVPYFEFNVLDTPIRNGVTRQTIKLDNGFVRVPEGPGLGIELNEEFIAQYAV
jgi:L-alanine-DL-glutamate epimerase-like enolase superfamily enzyme